MNVSHDWNKQNQKNNHFLWNSIFIRIRIYFSLFQFCTNLNFNDGTWKWTKITFVRVLKINDIEWLLFLSFCHRLEFVIHLFEWYFKSASEYCFSFSLWCSVKWLTATDGTFVWRLHSESTALKRCALKWRTYSCVSICFDNCDVRKLSFYWLGYAKQLCSLQSDRKALK